MAAGTAVLDSWEGPPHISFWSNTLLISHTLKQPQRRCPHTHHALIHGPGAPTCTPLPPSPQTPPTHHQRCHTGAVPCEGSLQTGPLQTWAPKLGGLSNTHGTGTHSHRHTWAQGHTGTNRAAPGHRRRPHAAHASLLKHGCPQQAPAAVTAIRQALPPACTCSWAGMRKGQAQPHVRGSTKPLPPACHWQCPQDSQHMRGVHPTHRMHMQRRAAAKQRSPAEGGVCEIGQGHTTPPTPTAMPSGASWHPPHPLRDTAAVHANAGPLVATGRHREPAACQLIGGPTAVLCPGGSSRGPAQSSSIMHEHTGIAQGRMGHGAAAEHSREAMGTKRKWGARATSQECIISHPQPTTHSPPTQHRLDIQPAGSLPAIAPVVLLGQLAGRSLQHQQTSCTCRQQTAAGEWGCELQRPTHPSAVQHPLVLLHPSLVPTGGEGTPARCQ
jgi:hypothetical protein